MAQEQLRKALDLMRQGNKQEASQIAQAVLKKDRNNVNAWWLMANLFDDQPPRQRKALERVLAINPLHKGANKMMEALERGEAIGYRPKSERQQNPSQQIMTTQEIEFDWSKLEARDAQKKKQGEGMEDHHATRIAYIAMAGFALVIIAVVVILIVIPTIQDIIDPPPDKVVENFFVAMGNQEWDAMRELACLNIQPDIDRAMQQSINAGTAGQFTSDMSKLKFGEPQINGNTALVKVSGKFTVSSLGMTDTHDVKEYLTDTGIKDGETITVIREDDKWHICNWHIR